MVFIVVSTMIPVFSSSCHPWVLLTEQKPENPNSIEFNLQLVWLLTDVGWWHFISKFCEHNKLATLAFAQSFDDKRFRVSDIRFEVNEGFIVVTVEYLVQVNGGLNTCLSKTFLGHNYCASLLLQIITLKVSPRIYLKLK